MQSGLIADKEDQIIDISEAAVHMNRDDLRRLVPSYHVSAHSEHVLFGSAGRASFCEDELSHTGTLKVHPIDQEENEEPEELEEPEDDLLPASTAPMSDPCSMYLREIRSIAMTQQEAERQVRKDLAAAEEHITYIVLRTPLAIREMISLGCKLESDKVSIREITGAISEEAAEWELDFHKNRIIALIWQIKQAEQKKQILYKQDDCGQLDKAGGNLLQQKIDSCTEQQIALLRKINLSRTVISRIVLTLKQCHRHLQKARDEGRADKGIIKHMEEDKTMLDYAILKQTIALIEDEEKKIVHARQMLITTHLGLVVYVAKRYKNSGLDFTDLIQEGNIGLMKAASRFDTNKQYHFKSEAIWYIKNAIIRAIIKRGKTIRIPDYICIIMNKLASVSGHLRREMGREPTTEEIGNILGVSPHKYYHLYAMQKFVSLDQPCKEDDSSRLKDLIEDDTCVSPGDMIDKRNLHASVKKMMERLTHQEKRVVSMRYGIGCESDHTLEKVGEALSLTRQRIKQIEDKALSKLVKYSKRNGLEAFIEA